VDTVFDHDYSDVPPEQRNGFVFHHVDDAALESALARAIELWHRYPAQFRQLRLNGMRTDRSWAHPGRAYLSVYDHVRHKDAAARQPELDRGEAARHDRWGPERLPSRGGRRAGAARK
jgi:glycogen synthase